MEKQTKRPQCFYTEAAWQRYQKANAATLPLIPAIERAMGGEMVLVEDLSSPVNVLLDAKAGVDAILVYSHHIRTVALRTQYTLRPYNTYSIRYSLASGNVTEYEKFLEAIEGSGGFMYPTITIQLYLHPISKKLIEGAAIYTKDLYLYAKKNINSLTKIVNKKDKNTFIPIRWKDLEIAGIKIKRITP